MKIVSLALLLLLNKKSYWDRRRIIDITTREAHHAIHFAFPQFWTCVISNGFVCKIGDARYHRVENSSQSEELNLDWKSLTEPRPIFTFKAFEALFRRCPVTLLVISNTYSFYYSIMIQNNRAGGQWHPAFSPIMDVFTINDDRYHSKSQHWCHHFERFWAREKLRIHVDRLDFLHKRNRNNEKKNNGSSLISTWCTLFIFFVHLGSWISESH